MKMWYLIRLMDLSPSSMLYNRENYSGQDEKYLNIP